MIWVFLLRYGCQYGLKVKLICSDSGSNTARVAWRKYRYHVRMGFCRIPKIGHNLKTNEYFFVKILTVYGKKPNVAGHVLSFSNIHRIFIFGIFYTGFRFFGTPYTWYIWRAHLIGQDLSVHTKMFTLVTLTLTIESAFRFRKVYIILTLIFTHKISGKNNTNKISNVSY